MAGSEKHPESYVGLKKPQIPPALQGLPSHKGLSELLPPPAVF